MKNIHVLPTDKPSRLYLTKEGFYFLLPNIKGNDAKFQNIYITSDDEIKVGDWVIEFQKGDNIGEVHFINNEYVIAQDIQKKIILTTDQDLIKDGVQAIDDEFLEWFVKNPSCEEIEVITEQYTQNYHKDIWYNRYKIIIPKEEQDKKLYSEEEVIQIVLDLRFKIELDSTREEIKEWFEQFKKK
jgi:hypothetical protein